MKRKPILLILFSATFFALTSSAFGAETGFLEMTPHSPYLSNS